MARGVVLCALAALLGICAARATAHTQASATFAWAGWADEVGPWWESIPDGYRDAHFRLTVDAPGEVLTAIVINPIKADGSLGTITEWNTTPLDQRWIVGVDRDGVRINKTDVPICDPVGTAAVYDLYAEDDGSIATLKRFRVTLTFGSGASATADMNVGDLSGGLPAAPKGIGYPTAAQAPPTEVGACVSSDGSSSTTTGPTTTTTPKPAPKPKPKPAPLCKKGQKSTAKKPCRKPKKR